MASELSSVLDVFRALGRKRGIRLYAPADAAELADRFAEMGHPVPDAIGEFYSQTDGLDIGDFRVCSVLETMWQEPDAFAMHIWDNGDVDCALVVPESTSPRISFMGHDPPWRFEVAGSVSEWLRRVYDEFVRFGEIAGPLDCRKLGIRGAYWPPEHLE